jgi:isopenicillin N synthase-like dioxygenase
MTTPLPVIDLSRYTGDSREDFLAELRRAAHEVGFFYVTGHGVDPAVTAGVLAAARSFFALPEADRRTIENVWSPHFRGWSSTGTEYTAGTPDQREQVDIGVERQPLKLGPDDPAYLGLIGPNQWPAAAPELRPAAEAWLAAADRVARTVLRALAAALGQHDGYFDGWFDDEATLHLKLIHYPGGAGGGGGGGGAAGGFVQGVGSHKDYGYLTVLLQDDLGGLQVEGPDGSWLDAPPLPGTFVVNIGELLEIATQGYLRATVHRVAGPAAGTDRYSAPVFLAPRLDAVVEPLTLPAGLAAPARGVDQDPDNVLDPEYGRKALAGWLRSHPRVAERWWDDVVTGALS